jgi:hypothetical protein
VQTGRSLNARYKEHISSVRNDKETSIFAMYILNVNHAYGKMEDIMGIRDHQKEVKTINIKDNFNIYLYKNNFTDRRTKDRRNY